MYSPVDEHRYAPGRFFLVALLFVAAAPVFWRQVEIRQGPPSQGYENAELYQRVYPAFRYGFTRLQAGELPLWDPNQACGTPFLADPCHGVFQPLNALFMLLPIERAMALHSYVCLSLMGLFFVLFIRALGVRHIPALAGGVAYAFCGASAAAMSRPELANTMAWAPFLFWALHVYAGRWRTSGAVLAGVALALLLLSGSPALAVAVLCLWAPYAAYLALFPGRAPGATFRLRIRGLLAIIGVAALVSAVQWVPSLAWLLSLDGPLDALWRLDLAGLTAPEWRRMIAQLLMTRPDALPHLGYIGIGALLVMPMAILHRRARRSFVFFVVAGPLFLVLAGSGWLAMPFGFPREAFVVPSVFSLSVLAALGLDRLLASAREPHAPGIWGPALLVVAAAAVLLWAGSADARGRVLVVLIAIVPFVVFRARPAAVVGGLSFALLLFIDLTLANANADRHPFEDAPACYHLYAKTIGTAQEHALGGRLLVSADARDTALPANLGMVFPVTVAGGSLIPLTKQQAVWWARLSGGAQDVPATGAGPTPGSVESTLINFMAVRAIVSSPNGPLHDGSWAEKSVRFRQVLTDGDARLVVNQDALPRAYCVSSWRVSQSIEDTLDILSNPYFDGVHGCVIAEGTPGLEALEGLVPETRHPTVAGIPNDDSVATCTMTEDSAERIVIHVEGSEPVVTVLADNFTPGWHATLDGIAWPILQTNGIFRGIATPAGAHDIVFTYRPVSFTVGLGATLGAVVMFVLLGLRSLVRKG